jgi:hypothetical protein
MKTKKTLPTSKAIFYTVVSTQVLKHEAEKNLYFTIKVNKKNATWVDYIRKFWIPFITLKVIHYEVVEN